jgi:phage shock protein C
LFLLSPSYGQKRNTVSSDGFEGGNRMQTRLTRSTTDKMLLGVCGGLGNYFAIDPVLVRLVFVLTTLTSGAGLPIYIILAIVMPREPRQHPMPAVDAQSMGYHDHLDEQAAHPAYQPETAEDASHEVMVAQAQAYAPRQRVAEAELFGPPPAPEAGSTSAQMSPIDMEMPATGATERLTGEPPPAAIQPPQPAAGPQGDVPAVPPHRRNWRLLGFILLGIGGLAALEQFGVNMSIVFPLLLIVAGVFLLGRGRQRHS